MAKNLEIKRCEWCERDDLYRSYHDNEWGQVIRDERKLFEFIVLESFQAGLSWYIVLKKRESLRVAFDGFKPSVIAKYDEAKFDEILKYDGAIKNRAKIAATSANAKAFLAVQSEFGSFYEYIWGFVGGIQIKNNWRNIKEIPAKTPLSEYVAKDMKKRGFKFFGAVSAYSFLQAIGVIDDHLSYCYKRQN
ncbi:DNA-3-methyladenine glycosylase I [Campylobacter anatolicus]|uniref:DNA-3-methyladenine glycosylase I n=1 Tax=Campylobacter anatolicus TaxID=2829105 RepID=UPI001E46F921|nr:DNA-3-methyladenine glycosylase I [Campylobacter anatolicus]